MCHLIDMKWPDLLALLGQEVVFRSSILLGTGESPLTIRRQIARWVESGRLEQLRRGVYAIAPPYRARTPHPFVVAGLLRPTGYVSLQSALAHYGLIPEHVPVVTSVTTARPENIDTPLGTFLFRHIARHHFHDYESVALAAGENALVALPEKALLDTIHLTPRGHSPAFLAELRLQNLESLDLHRLRRIAERSGSAKLRTAADRVCRMAKQGGPD
jgi:predicted transcriptional regulator of viral defense system